MKKNNQSIQKDLAKKIWRYSSLCSLIFLINSCTLSFKGISIAPEVNTFYVADFDNTSRNIVPTLARTFTEKMKDKVRQNTRLSFDETSPHVEFEGAITTYRVTAEAPEAGETVGTNRLTIGVQVTYTDHLVEENSFSSSFSYFLDFGVSQDLLSVQDDLIDEITDQLVEDVFNKAFTNW